MSRAMGSRRSRRSCKTRGTDSEKAAQRQESWVPWQVRNAERPVFAAVARVIVRLDDGSGLEAQIGRTDVVENDYFVASTLEPDMSRRWQR